MNLKGLFQRLLPPKKSGAPLEAATELHTVARYSLVFNNIENSPEYSLETELSVGSETGDIVIEDPSLGARHATFKLDRGAVTVMDLGSGLTTQIGDHVLTKGKPVLLNPNDVLQLGEIQILFKVYQEEIENPSAEAKDEKTAIHHLGEKEKESIDDIPVETELRLEGIEDNQKIISVETSAQMKARIQTLRTSKAKPQLVGMGGGRTLAANLLPRLIAIVIDFCWSIVVWTVFAPFEEFQEALEIVPEFLHDHVLPFIEIILTDYGLGESYQEWLNVFLENIKDVESQIHLSYLVSLYFTLRVIFTFVLGVSLGQWMAGIRGYGQFISVRLRGVFRECLGVFTWLFVVLDLPTLFSRRSFKEWITGSHLVSTSKGAMLIAWLLFIPLTLICLFIAPLFAGLEEPNAILLSETPTGKTSNKDLAAQEMQTTSSEWFRAQFVLPKDAWRVFPRFSWTQSSKGRSLTPTLAFYHQKGSMIPLVLHATFSWDRLLSLGLAHNPLLQANFPTLWSYVQAQKVTGSSSLKFQLSEAQELSFRAELEQFIKISFEISLDNYFEHLLTHGPLIKGLVDFRKELELLVGKMSDAEWSMSRYGKSSMLVYEVPGVKPFDIMLPLESGEGRLFRVNYASTKERAGAVKLARKELWGRSRWVTPKDMTVDGLALVIDAIAQTASGGKINESNFEKIFGAYFETASALVLLPETDFARKPYVQSLKNIIDVVNKISKQRMLATSTKENLTKLAAKLSEMKGHFEAANIPFFQSDVKVP